MPLRAAQCADHGSALRAVRTTAEGASMAAMRSRRPRPVRIDASDRRDDDRGMT